MRSALLLQLFFIVFAYGAASPLAGTNDYFYTILGAPNNIAGRIMDKDRPYSAVRSEDIAYIAESINERYALVTGNMTRTNLACDVYLLQHQVPLNAMILNQCQFLDPEYKFPSQIIKVKNDLSVTNLYHYIVTNSTIIAQSNTISQTMKDGSRDVYTSVQWCLKKEEDSRTITNINFGTSGMLMNLLNAEESNSSLFSEEGISVVMAFTDLRFADRSIAGKRIADKLYHINDAYRVSRGLDGWSSKIGSEYQLLRDEYNLSPDVYWYAYDKSIGRYRIAKTTAAKESSETYNNTFVSDGQEALSSLLRAAYVASWEKEHQGFYITANNGITFEHADGSPVTVETKSADFDGVKTPLSYIRFKIGNDSSGKNLRPDCPHINDISEIVQLYCMFDVLFSRTPDYINRSESYIVPMLDYLGSERMPDTAANIVSRSISIPDTRKILVDICRVEGFPLDIGACSEPMPPQLGDYTDEDLRNMYSGPGSPDSKEGLVVVKSHAKHILSATMTYVGFIAIIDLTPKTLIKETK